MAASFLHLSTAPTLSSITKTKTHLPSHSYKPIRVNMVQNQTNWATVNSEVESHIEHALSGRQPASVFDPMNRLVSEVPRSMAPALCIAACEAVGGHKNDAITAASTLHLMHVATYTHEYLELSDQPKNKPLAHHAFGPDIELPTADNMVQLGYELLAEMDDGSDNNSDRVIKVTIEVARAMGAQGMVNGQYLKMRWMGLEGDESCEEGTIDEAFEKKGGALYSCGAACGAILGGGSDEEVEKLRKYGLYVGMIHNIMLHDGLGRDKRLLKLAESLRFLARKELEGMKDKNIEPMCSIMDGFSAFLKVQKYQFPKRA